MLKIRNSICRGLGLMRFDRGSDVIDAVLNGEDCLCIMPTGGGKSLCYQLPSVARVGTTLVVSPLIALMKDQVDSLQAIGVSAAFVNSALNTTEQEERLLRFSAGEYDLLYVAPERFRSPKFLEAVRKTKIGLLAIDEAHCISEWGHDFRHDYARLGEFRERLGKPQTIALTATATTDVREDVLNQLQLKDPKVFVAGFARENLHYMVESHRGKQAKQEALLSFLENTAGCGIIYASTRATCEEIRDLLLDRSNRKVIAYHGGLMPDERRRLQDVFMSGEAEIVVATNAFGMGIDKSDVRFVVHFNIPGSLEAYYQEAGRAGRDGKPSVCLLLYSQSDRFIQEFFIDSAHPPKESIAKVYNYLCKHPDDPIELTQSALKEELGLSIGPDGVGTCERMLEKANVLERLDSARNLAAVRVEIDVPNLAELLPSQAKSQRKIARAVGNLVGEHRFERFYFHPNDLCTLSGEELSAVNRALRELNRNDWFDYVPPFRGRAVHMLRRDLPFHKLDIDYTRLEQRRKSNLDKLDRVIRFAMTRRCRQRDILRYFGENTSEKCGHCDNCDAQPPQTVGSISVERNDDTSITPAMVEISRKVLSGVARSQGKFGKTVVVSMLCGSKAAKIKKWNLDRLSTFGLLSGFKQSEVTDIVDALISLSLIKMVEIDKFRPTLHNSDEGKEVMMGRATLPEILELDNSLLQKIERTQKGKLKRQTAEEGAGDVSPKVKAIKEEQSEVVAVTQATDESIHGPASESAEPVERDLANTGVKLLPDSVQDLPSKAEGLSGDVLRPSYYWTWRLLHDGYSFSDCASIRGSSSKELLDDLTRGHEDGLLVESRWFLDKDQMKWLTDHISSNPDVRPLAEDLPDGISAAHFRLFAKCRTNHDDLSRSRA